MRLIVCHRLPRILLLVPLLAIFIQACRNAPAEENAPRVTPEEEKEMLMRINKFLVRKDIDLIESYASRRGWDMQVTETGLFYEIYEQTEGRQAAEGMDIRLDYRLSLLDGTLCYSAEKDGFKEFRLGRGQEISGLEQGVAMMQEGEKARLIIPPHLAYGLLGDEKRIPARSIIIYEIVLLEANQE